MMAETRTITPDDVEKEIAALTEQLKRDESTVKAAEQELKLAQSRRDGTKRAIEAWTASLKILKDAGVR